MSTRRSIRISGEVFDDILGFCKENNISMSMFLEERIKEYLYRIKPYPRSENWSGQESWILFVTYSGKTDLEKNELIQVAVGRRGGTCEGGLSFTFDSTGTSNRFLAQESKKRVLQEVQGVEAEVYRYKIDHGMD